MALENAGKPKRVTATKKSALLDQFYNEKVLITTDISNTIQLPEGELAEVPLMLEGMLLDYDADFLLIGAEGRDAIELIRRDNVISIKQVNAEMEVLNNFRPGDEELN
jgi:hypothetical protein